MLGSLQTLLLYYTVKSSRSNVDIKGDRKDKKLPIKIFPPNLYHSTDFQLMTELSKTKPKHNPLHVKYYAYAFGYLSELCILLFVNIGEVKQNFDALIYLDKSEIRVSYKKEICFFFFFFLIQSFLSFPPSLLSHRNFHSCEIHSHSPSSSI